MDGNSSINSGGCNGGGNGGDFPSSPTMGPTAILRTNVDVSRERLVLTPPVSISAPSHRELLSQVRTLIQAKEPQQQFVSMAASTRSSYDTDLSSAAPAGSTTASLKIVSPTSAVVSAPQREEASRRAQLQDTIERLERRQTDLKAQISSLNAQLEQARCHRTRLSSELQAQRLAASTAAEALAKARHSQSEMQHQMAKLRNVQAELKALEARLMSEVEARRKAEEQLEEVTAHEQCLAEKNEALSAQLQQMRMSLTASKAEKVATAKRAEEAAHDLQEARLRIDSLNERLAETTANYQQALQDIVRLTSEKQRAAESAERYDAAAQTLLAVQKENQSLVAEINRAHESQASRILELSRDLRAAHEEGRELRNAQNALEQLRAEEAAKYEELKSEVARLCESLQSERTGKNALEEELAALRASTTTAETDETALRETITAELSAQTSQAVMELHEALKQELAINASLRGRIAELEADLNREQNIRQELSENYNVSPEGDDHVLLHELRAENELLWCRLDESRDRDTKLRAEIDKLKEQLLELRGTEAGLALQELRETQAQLEAVKANLAAATMDTSADAASTASGSEGGKGRLMESLYSQIDALQREIAVITRSREDLQAQTKHAAAALVQQKELAASAENEVHLLREQKLSLERRIFELENGRDTERRKQQQQQMPQTTSSDCMDTGGAEAADFDLANAEAADSLEQETDRGVLERLEERHLVAQDALRAQLEAQQVHVDEMERVALNTKKQQRDLEQQVADLQGKLEDALLKLKSAQVMAATQAETLSAAAKSKDTEQAAFATEMQNQNRDLQQQVEKQRAELERQRHEFERTAAQLVEKEAEESARDAEIEVLRLRVNELTEARERKAREQIALQSRLAALERQCERLTQPDDGAVPHRQLQDLQVQLDESKVKAAEAAESIEELRSQLEDAAAKLAEASEGRQRAKLEIEKLNKELDVLRMELMTLKTEKQTADDELQTMQKKMADFNAMAEELHVEKARGLEAEKLNAALEKSSGQIACLQTQIADLEEQLRVAREAEKDQGDVETLRLTLRKQQLRFFEELKEIRRMVVPGYLDNYSLDGLSRLQKRFVFHINELLQNGFLDEIRTSRLPVARTLEAKDLRTEVARLEVQIAGQTAMIAKLKNDASSWEKKFKTVEHQDRDELRIKSTLLDKAEAEICELRRELVQKENALKLGREKLVQQSPKQQLSQSALNEKEKKQLSAYREKCQTAEAKLKKLTEETQKDYEVKRIETDELRAMLALMQQEKSVLLAALSRCKWVHWVMVLFGAVVGIVFF